MLSESLRNSTIAVPAGLGPTARPWSGGLTSPGPPKVGELAAELMADVRPSKPLAPGALPVKPLSDAPERAACLAAWTPCDVAERAAAGGSRSGVSCAGRFACAAGELDTLACLRWSVDASVRSVTAPDSCRVMVPPAVPVACERAVAGSARAVVIADAVAGAAIPRGTAVTVPTRARRPHGPLDPLLPGRCPHAGSPDWCSTGCSPLAGD